MLATALLGLLLGPLASPAAALLGGAVCDVTGRVSVGPWAVRVQPPASAATVPGYYFFSSVLFVCVGGGVFGAPLGTFVVASSGNTNGGGCSSPSGPLTGTFCGSYNLVTPFAIGLLPCSGRVGGPGIGFGGNPPLGPWSLTTDTFILGYIDCPAMGLLLVGNAGSLNLGAYPDPTAGTAGVLGTGPCVLPPVNLLGDLLGLAPLQLLGYLLLLYYPLTGVCGLIVDGTATFGDA